MTTGNPLPAPDDAGAPPESEPGHGSTFRVEIPTQCPEQPGPRRAVVDYDHLSGLHALVVDDNANNRKILQRQLEGWGTTCEAAAGGEDALRLAGEGDRYDVCVLDLDMPGMDGVEVARALRAMPHYERLPPMLMSSMAWHGDRGGKELFVVELIKPVKSIQLLKALAWPWNRSRAHRSVPVVPAVGTSAAAGGGQ